MISPKIEKAMKIETYIDMPEKVYGFMEDCTRWPECFANEAAHLGRVMTGQETWQGIKSEMVHYSGLASKANKYLATTSTTLRIKEVTVYGNGKSMYHLA